eukprot:MONOS_8575.1-p1 / transcript=MONOS_8575.1 / gene=MONOS_8575 / organism=Monocercomonoides_exilis_PA203 / gene_product=unspecified product / transcript_product=unspecified product / location=Mono_scaffold00326:57205-57906(-) / protein_length=197 / sequence_SO=supercontig / SO=protein_coding / is_pseudo=false
MNDIVNIEASLGVSQITNNGRERITYCHYFTIFLRDGSTISPSVSYDSDHIQSMIHYVFTYLQQLNISNQFQLPNYPNNGAFNSIYPMQPATGLPSDTIAPPSQLPASQYPTAFPASYPAAPAITPQQSFQSPQFQPLGFQPPIPVPTESTYQPNEGSIVQSAYADSNDNKTSLPPEENQELTMHQGFAVDVNIKE